MKNDTDGKKAMREAAALKYDADMDDAPYIVALGKGYIAQRMIEKAHENKVHVVKDKKLSHLLNELSVGDEIPEELYLVVAEILMFVSNLDSEYKSKLGLL